MDKIHSSYRQEYMLLFLTDTKHHETLLIFKDSPLL